MRQAYIVILLLLLSLPMQAQLKKNRIGSRSRQQVSLAVGVNHPVMELETKHGPSVEASYTYFFKPMIGLKGFAQYNYFWNKNDSYNAHFMGIGAEAVFNFFTYKKGRSERAGGSAIPESLYLHGGIGIAGFVTKPQTPFVNGVTAMFPIGLGIDWAVADNWCIGLDASYHFTITDKVDNIVSGKMTDSYPTLMIAVTYKFPEAHRSGTGFGYKKARQKCDPRKGCSITYE